MKKGEQIHTHAPEAQYQPRSLFGRPKSFCVEVKELGLRSMWTDVLGTSRSSHKLQCDTKVDIPWIMTKHGTDQLGPSKQHMSRPNLHNKAIHSLFRVCCIFKISRTTDLVLFLLNTCDRQRRLKQLAPNNVSCPEPLKFRKTVGKSRTQGINNQNPFYKRPCSVCVIQCSNWLESSISSTFQSSCLPLR